MKFKTLFTPFDATHATYATSKRDAVCMYAAVTDVDIFITEYTHTRNFDNIAKAWCRRERYGYSHTLYKYAVKVPHRSLC